MLEGYRLDRVQAYRLVMDALRNWVIRWWEEYGDPSGKYSFENEIGTTSYIGKGQLCEILGGGDRK